MIGLLLHKKKPATFLALAIGLSSALQGGMPIAHATAVSPNSENAELHVIDVYEGIPHEAGIITVHVTKKTKPLVLYFGAYQPVKWNLIVEPSVRIERIILSGYHSQTVGGAPPDVPILTLPYRAGYSSSGISKPASLQGSYKGSIFYIGGMPSYKPPPSPRIESPIPADPEGSRHLRAELPLANSLTMALPISYGDGSITSEIIDRYKTIAVLKFSEDSKAPGSGSIASGLTTHLLTLAGFNPVERVQLGSLLSEQQLQLRHGDEHTMAVNVGRLTGATAVAVGEIHEWGYTRAVTDMNTIVELPTVSISLRIIDAEKGTILFSGHGQFISEARTTLNSAASKLLNALVLRFELKAGLISSGTLGFSWNRQLRSGISEFIVTQFSQPSMAYAAGLRLGDVLLGCNGSPSSSWATDWHAKRACQAEAHQLIVLNIRRGEERRTMTVRARNRLVEAKQ